jgi:urea transporter
MLQYIVNIVITAIINQCLAKNIKTQSVPLMLWTIVINTGVLILIFTAKTSHLPSASRKHVIIVLVDFFTHKVLASHPTGSNAAVLLTGLGGCIVSGGLRLR